MKIWATLCTLLVSFLIGSFLTLIFVPPLRSLPAQVLVENDQPSGGGGAIILLMGDADDRAKHAAELLKHGIGEKIVFVEMEQDDLQKAGVKPREGQLVYDYLTKSLKVPEAKIIFDSSTAVSSTREEAKAILRLLSANKMTRNTLATSWYHSSRAAWIFRKVFAEEKLKKIHFASLPSPTPGKWYRHEKDFLNVYTEYLKWIYYYFKYEVLA